MIYPLFLCHLHNGKCIHQVTLKVTEEIKIRIEIGKEVLNYVGNLFIDEFIIQCQLLMDSPSSRCDTRIYE